MIRCLRVHELISTHAEPSQQVLRGWILTTTYSTCHKNPFVLCWITKYHLWWKTPSHTWMNINFFCPKFFGGSFSFYIGQEPWNYETVAILSNRILEFMRTNHHKFDFTLVFTSIDTRKAQSHCCTSNWPRLTRNSIASITCWEACAKTSPIRCPWAMRKSKVRYSRLHAPSASFACSHECACQIPTPISFPAI